MRNGRKHVGKILSQSRRIVKIRVGRKVRVLSKTKIKRIHYGKTKPAKPRPTRKKRPPVKKAEPRPQPEPETPEQKALKKKNEEIIKLKKEYAESFKREKAEQLKREQAEKIAKQKRSLQIQAALLQEEKAQAKAQKAKKIAAKRKKAAAAKLKPKPRPKSAKKPTIPVRHKIKTGLTPGGALWRSALLPGWGQWQRGRRLEGAIFGTGTAMGLMATYAAFTHYHARKKSYDTFGNPFTTGAITGLFAGFPADNLASRNLQETIFRDQLYKPRREARDAAYLNYQQAAAGTALFYLLNLAHAYFRSPAATSAPAPGSKNPVLALTPVFTTQGPGLQLKIQVRF